MARGSGRRPTIAVSKIKRKYERCLDVAPRRRRPLSAGENPKVVSERLGHASIVLTLDTYSHVLPTMQKEATNKIEKLMFGT